MSWRICMGIDFWRTTLETLCAREARTILLPIDLQRNKTVKSRPDAGLGLSHSAGESLLNHSICSFPDRQQLGKSRNESTLSCRLQLGAWFSNEGQQIRRNVERFRGWLVCEAHRLLFHATLGLRVLKKKKKEKKTEARSLATSVPPSSMSAYLRSPAWSAFQLQKLMTLQGKHRMSNWEWSVKVL